MLVTQLTGYENSDTNMYHNLEFKMSSNYTLPQDSIGQGLGKPNMTPGKNKTMKSHQTSSLQN
jgi:hypothetical protein